MVGSKTIASRQTVCSIFLIYVIVAGLSGMQPADAQSAGTELQDPPNIVLFIGDDLGAGDTGPYGNQVVRTPHLDRLAGESMLFSEAYAASPTCSPSRASIHTGLYPFRSGAHANHSGIGREVRTLPKLLADLGYSVALAGKYHIGPKEAYPFELINNTNIPEPGHEDDGVLWTDLNMEPVDRWLKDKTSGEKPFLLVVNDHSPHVIWPERPEYDSAAVDIPAFHIDTPNTRRARARYYTDITKMDRNVGTLLQSLDKYQLSKNTVVIFTADQGPQWAFGKWNLYDYGIKVPLLVRWPGVIEEGSESGALVSLVDLLPTAVDMAADGSPAIANDIDGRSFLPVLTGKQDQHHEQVFSSHTGDGTMNRSPMRMIRTKRYKYILNLAPEIRYHTHIDKAGDHDGGRTYWDTWLEQSYKTRHAASVLWRYHNRPKEELYDIRKDPDETSNLAANPEYAELIDEFRSRMDHWRKQQKDQETGPYETPDRKGETPVAPYIF